MTIPNSRRMHDMSDLQARLMAFAKRECVPYLRERFQGHLDRVAFLVVGSVATGLCNESSDVDIAVLCDGETYGELASGESWEEGRPSEARIQGVQLHYYVKSVEEICNELSRHDDVALYVYSTAIVLEDPQDLFRRRIAPQAASNVEVRKARLEGKLDMLMRRTGVLEHCLADGEDVHSTLKVWLGVFTLSLKTVALLDNVQFDPRKRLFQTALAGSFGGQCRETLLEQIRCMQEVVGMRQRGGGLIGNQKCLLERIKRQASDLGFTVGLDKPDRRHVE